MNRKLMNDGRVEIRLGTVSALPYPDNSVDELREPLLEAGFSDVEAFEEYEKGWICGVGRRLMKQEVQND